MTFTGRNIYDLKSYVTTRVYRQQQTVEMLHTSFSKVIFIMHHVPRSYREALRVIIIYDNLRKYSNKVYKQCSSIYHKKYFAIKIVLKYNRSFSFASHNARVPLTPERR